MDEARPHWIRRHGLAILSVLASAALFAVLVVVGVQLGSDSQPVVAAPHSGPSVGPATSGSLPLPSPQTYCLVGGTTVRHRLKHGMHTAEPTAVAALDHAASEGAVPRLDRTPHPAWHLRLESGNTRSYVDETEDGTVTITIKNVIAPVPGWVYLNSAITFGC